MHTPSPQRVQLLVTCIINSIYPQVGEAVVAVLERLGMQVEFPPDQTCCGQPAFNGGFWDEAQVLAARCLDIFEKSDAPVVVPSGSCAAMIVHGYPMLFADDPHQLARAQALAARTYEFSQFLVDVLKIDPAQLQARFKGKLTYHPSCHLTRLLGVKDAPRKLLAGIQDADIIPLPNAEECCGFGGLFAIKHGDISAAILERKLANIKASGADVVVGYDMSCLMNIGGGLNRDGSLVQCLHLAEILK